MIGKLKLIKKVEIVMKFKNGKRKNHFSNFAVKF